MHEYAAPLKSVGQAFADEYPASSDPSADLLIYLGLANRAAERLEEMGVDLVFQDRSLVLPHLEKAYREAFHLRNQVPADILDVSKISKIGRIVHEG